MVFWESSVLVKQDFHWLYPFGAELSHSTNHDWVDKETVMGQLLAANH